MDSMLYNKLLEDDVKLAERINLFKGGYCCYFFITGKITRQFINEPVFEETELCVVTKEMEFIINRFSHVLNNTMFGYWKVFYICPNYIWFSYTRLPNLSVISSGVGNLTTEVGKYVSNKLSDIISNN